ncbi:MAG: LytTR family DNA-binding domain-containing protein [Flavihumibacter sp.]|nr:LytTR family DNA-binding domain-containing protein [Flavihumibacter sp.]
MKILIVEDEEQAYKRLKKLIAEAVPGAVILDVVMSIQSAIKWFAGNPMPDLVFMDVNLADGESFEIFKQVSITCPIIFTTAYEEYAIKAFKVNSIAYLLKPVDKADIEAAMAKLHSIKGHSPAPDYVNLLKNLQQPLATAYRERFVVKLGDNLKSIPTDEVAYFFTENKANFLCTREGKKYPIDFNLDQVETQLNPKTYFRINRQFIIAMSSIDEMKSYTRSRVIIKLKPASHLDTIVSVERANKFRDWLEGIV